MLGAGTVQYMESKAVRKLTEELDESVLISDELSFDLFLAATGFSSGNGAYFLGRQEELVKFACKVVERPDINGATKAVATWFLCNVYFVVEAEAKEARERELKLSAVSDQSAAGNAFPMSHQANLVTANLDVARVAADFVTQVKERRFTESMARIMDVAFQVRPPPGSSEDDKEALEKERRSAMNRALPLMTADLLGLISRDPSTHGALANAGVANAAAKLMATLTDVPAAHELLANLSMTPQGRAAILRAEISEKLLSSIIPAILYDEKTEAFSTYDVPVIRRRERIYPKLNLHAVLANMINANNDAIQSYLYNNNIFTAAQRTEHENFNLETAQTSQLRYVQVSAATTAVIVGFGYGALRGAFRNWYRGMGFSYFRAAVESGLRAAVGAPFLLFSSELAWNFYSNNSDERLFITQAILGSTAALFFIRQVFAITPFSLFPAINAFSRILSPQQDALKRSRRERIDEFRSRSQAKPSSMEELGE